MICTMRFLLFLLLASFQFACFSQDLQYARSIVDTLASSMSGRGYVRNGDGKAADYIVNEFKKMGLKSYPKSYLQEFTTPVNTFPGAMHLIINGKTLNPGEDFLIDPTSPAVEGNFEAVSLSAEDFLDEGQLIFKLKDSFGKFLVIGAFDRADFSDEELEKIDEIIYFLKYNENSPAVGTIVLSYEKLTWSAAISQSASPVFTIKVDSLYEPVEKIAVEVDAQFIKTYKSQNVVGYVAGKSDDSLIVMTAHYDHLGMMGAATMFPGANDNASGVAMLLNLAQYYTENEPDFTIVFIAFAGEELGLLGSNHFTEKPLFPLKKIKFLINFDISGTGEEGIQVVNGSVYKDKFDKLQSINDTENLLQQVKIRGEACHSDHCMFYRKGVPSFFIYTLGGIQAYHDIYDKAETLPLTEFEDYFILVTKFIDAL